MFPKSGSFSEFKTFNDFYSRRSRRRSISADWCLLAVRCFSQTNIRRTRTRNVAVVLSTVHGIDWRQLALRCNVCVCACVSVCLCWCAIASAIYCQSALSTTNVMASRVAEHIYSTCRVHLAVNVASQVSAPNELILQLQNTIKKILRVADSCKFYCKNSKIWSCSVVVG